MPTAALIATQLTDHSARPFTVTLGALDVTRLANGGGVDIDTVSVTEQGPGGVSSMTFRVWDPDLAINVSDADPVEFWDNDNALPMFVGFVQTWSNKPATVSRYVEVVCVGVEVLLDWMVVPSLTIPALTPIGQAVQMIASAAIPLGVALRYGGNATSDGTLAAPVGIISSIPSFSTQSVVVITGQSIREAIRTTIAECIVVDNWAGWFGGPSIYPVQPTVDFWHGLRLWRVGYRPDDYADLTVTDTTAGALAASVLDHEADSGGVVRGVYVIGGNAAGTGLVPDGSGIPGQIAIIEDATILTADAKNRAASAYLAEHTTAERGSLVIGSYNPTTNVRAGSNMSLTDAQVGVTVAGYPIASITKTFHKTGAGIRQTWTVAYGGLRPSAMRLIRRLTRDVRS